MCVCPYVRMFCVQVDAIGREKGLCEADLADASAEDIIWQRFLESACLNSAGQKVGMCRWFQVFVCLRRLLVDWSSLLVVLIRANLHEPWMDQSVLVGVVEPVNVDAGMPGAGEMIL